MMKMVYAFRNRGHFAASLDPLLSTERGGRVSSWLSENPDKQPDTVRLTRRFPPHLDLRPFGLENANLSKKYYLGKEVKSMNGQTEWDIPELVTFLCRTYSGTVGFEYAHVDDEEQRDWLKDYIEGWHGTMTKSEKLAALSRLSKCDLVGKYLGEKFPSAKVFGIEGCEVLIPGLAAMLETASFLGVEDVEMGMAHRGRMSVLLDLLQKPLHTVINQFRESEPANQGDIKYHLGTRAELVVIGPDGVERNLHVSLEANPSHLEAVNSVVIGKTRAKQYFRKDIAKKRILPLLLHGDAAFSGQGIVPEVMELSNLPDYTVGGCIHVVINNQIGFTTDPRLARSSYHCTNVAKRVGAPIFHVNGDDVEAVVGVFKLAAAWRQRFNRDCVVDIICYRRHGHNSLDDPSSTAPLLYAAIKKHPGVVDIYKDKLIGEGIICLEEYEKSRITWRAEFDQEFEISRSYEPNAMEWLGSNWQGEAIGSLVASRPYNQTGVREATLKLVGNALISVPHNFSLHKDISKLLQQRRNMLESGHGISMAFAESLAFGCLMTRCVASSESSDDREFVAPLQDHPVVHVRLSGQDSIRGTFNQRHAAIHCQRTDQVYWQLNNIVNVNRLSGSNSDEVLHEQASISVCNSSLSEASILGFEYGYSLGNETALTIWEAQFGDFANVAQSIIDNFIVSGESKWNNRSSLVMLLPHGFDGQGPEHSSARLERFLQLIDDDSDIIPGKSALSEAEIRSGFDAIANEVARKNGTPANVDSVSKEDFARAIRQNLAPDMQSERLDLAIHELLEEHEIVGIDKNAFNEGRITRHLWCRLMSSWLQSNAERKCNFIVVSPTTPAQYFHCLRRQIHRPFAKPLVVMSAKWMLHHKPCASRMQDMTTGTFFQRVIIEGCKGDNMSPSIDAVPASTTNELGDDGHPIKSGNTKLLEPEKIRRVIFCTGKIFYHLYHQRSTLSIDNVTLVRIEQIAPFPYHLVELAIRRFPNAECVWVQEEAKNMGAWSYVKPRFDTCLREYGMLHRSPLRYVGRKPSSSPASGAYSIHMQEQKELIELAFASIQ